MLLPSSLSYYLVILFYKLDNTVVDTQHIVTENSSTSNIKTKP